MNQILLNGIDLNDLLNRICKVWGFVKYYHSNVSTCHVNWDSVLLRTLPLVESATTNNAFNDALDTMLSATGPMAIATTSFIDTFAPAMKRNRDWNWMSTPFLRTDVQIQLDTIKNNFRPHANCWYDQNPNEFTTSLAAPWGGHLMFGADSVLLRDTTYVTMPDKDHRLLEFFKCWNILRYFNPYNYVLDVSWDTTLYNYSVPISNITNGQDLANCYLKIATALNDAHVYGLTYSPNYQIPPGFYKPYLRLKYINSQYVVVNSLETGIYPGDAIISIDGLTTTQWEDSLKQYYSSGNISVLRRTMCQNMLGRMSYGTIESVVVEDSNGVNHTFNLNCIWPGTNFSFFYNTYYPADSLSTIRWTTMPCDIAYLNMANVPYADATGMYDSIRNKSAMILDLRNDCLAEGYLAPLMMAGNSKFSKLMFPDTTFPGSYYLEDEWIGMPGNPTPYTGLVILLIGEGSQSHVEYSSMVFEAMPNVIKVGSQTAGADGDVTWLRTSYDMRFGWTSMGVFYPNGDSTQRIGIVPDSVVYLTRSGVRHQRDEVLEKALYIAGCNLSTNDVKVLSPSIMVYPNPAQNELIITSTDKICSVVITNLVGETVYDNKHDAKHVQIDVAQLSAGLYLIKINGIVVKKFVKQ